MFHRTAWLIRDTTDTGKSRITREIVATVIDPITGLNRFISRDAGRVVEKPAEYIPSSLIAAFDVGVLWRGDDLSFVDAAGEPFVQTTVGYGNALGGTIQAALRCLRREHALAGAEERFRSFACAGGCFGRPIGGHPDTPSRRTVHFIVSAGLRLPQQLRIPVRRPEHRDCVHRRAALLPGVAPGD